MTTVRVSLDGVRHHAVQFYRSPEFLADVVSRFVAEGLGADEAVIVVARSQNLDVFLANLRRRGTDIDGALARGQLFVRDAHDAIGRYVRDGRVDPERFNELVLDLVRQAGRQPVRIYGEMVDVLWRQGNGDAVLVVEKLWHEIVQRFEVRLLCAYGLDGFEHAGDSVFFDHICRHHTSSLPSEHFLELEEDAKNAALATLEQRAAALSAEVADNRRHEAATSQLLRLAEAVSRADTLDQVYPPALEAVTSLLEAERASVLLFDADDVMRFKAWRGLSDDYRRAVEGHSPWRRDAEDPVPILVGDVETAAQWADYLPLFRREGIRALGFVPLVHRRRLLGKLMFYCSQPRSFSHREVELAKTVANHVSQAVARATLFEAERRARADAELQAERILRLQRVTSRLTRTALPEEVASLLLEEGADVGGANSSAVWVFDESRTRLELLHSHRYPETVLQSLRSLSLDRRKPIIDAACTGEPVWLETQADFAARYPESEAETRSELDEYRQGFTVACLPLRVDDRTLGAAAWGYTRDRALTRSERDLLLALSQQCAQAFERARLLEAERKARRAREEVLALVSHDLRNPLNTIVLGAAELQGFELGERAPRLRKSAEKIQRSAQRMSRLIDDLVDFATIQAGKLALFATSHSADSLVAAVIDMFEGLAQERELRLEGRLEPSLPRLTCDHDRTVQALANLVANAVKVTSPGGVVSVAARRERDEIWFTVSDTGPGIATDELPRLFQRYWRSERAGYRGTGLGLAITKGIVDAHGGRIWVESTLGEGTRFYLALRHG